MNIDRDALIYLIFIGLFLFKFFSVSLIVSIYVLEIQPRKPVHALQSSYLFILITTIFLLILDQNFNHILKVEMSILFFIKPFDIHKNLNKIT